MKPREFTTLLRQSQSISNHSADRAGAPVFGQITEGPYNASRQYVGRSS
jgi:hypothetical protein